MSIHFIIYNIVSLQLSSIYKYKLTVLALCYICESADLMLREKQEYNLKITFANTKRGNNNDYTAFVCVFVIL